MSFPVPTTGLTREFTYLPAADNVGPHSAVYAEKTGYPIYNGTGTFTPDYVTESGSPNNQITNYAPASVDSALPEPSTGLFLDLAVAVLACGRGLRLKGPDGAAAPFGLGP